MSDAVVGERERMRRDLDRRRRAAAREKSILRR
jgi:hypothetical protein